MKKKKILIISIVVLLLGGLFTFIKANIVTCSVVKNEEMQFCAPKPQMLNFVQQPDRKLIKTGELSFECDRLDETRGLVEEAIGQFGGYISDERLNMHETRSSQWLEIRVPAEHFDALVEAISCGASRLEQRSIRTEDVTAEYLDTETRLSVKRELEARYRELLNAATTVKDILAIEEQIASLREDIESAEVQIKRFDDRITLSTLEVTFYKIAEEAPVRFAKHFRAGVSNGWKNLIWLSVGLVNIWPFMLIIGLILIVVKIRRAHHS